MAKQPARKSVKDRYNWIDVQYVLSVINTDVEYTKVCTELVSSRNGKEIVYKFGRCLSRFNLAGRM